MLLKSAEIELIPPCYKIPGSRLFFIDKVTAVGWYDGRLREYIILAKRNSLYHIKFLSGLLILRLMSDKEFLSCIKHDRPLVVPVPSSSNFASALADIVGRAFRFQVIKKNLVKLSLHLNGQSQHNLTAKERWQNARSAFALCNPSVFFYNNILLVDDVLTTGATANYCAKLLKITGKAKRVDVVVMARRKKLTI